MSTEESIFSIFLVWSLSTFKILTLISSTQTRLQGSPQLIGDPNLVLISAWAKVDVFYEHRDNFQVNQGTAT